MRYRYSNSSLASLVAILAGFGAGMAFSGLSLAPKESQSGDKYMQWTIAGLVILAIANLLRWLLQRKAIARARQMNLKELLEKK